jgi:hypothetical protein
MIRSEEGKWILPKGREILSLMRELLANLHQGSH